MRRTPSQRRRRKAARRVRRYAVVSRRINEAMCEYVAEYDYEMDEGGEQ